MLEAANLIYINLVNIGLMKNIFIVF